MANILIHSFKGGCGKTLFSVNIARYLASQGKKVLLVETDFNMPSFVSIFPEIKPDIYLNTFLESKETNLGNYHYQYNEDPNLDIIFANPQYNPSSKIFSQDQEWFLEKIHQLRKAVDNLEHDYIIFDTTPGFNLMLINLLYLANGLYLIMRTDSQSIRGSKFLIEKIYSKTIDMNRKVKTNILFNQIPKIDQMNGIIDQITQEFTIKFPYLKNFHSIYYEHATSFRTTIEQFVLPDDDPTFEEFRTIGDDLLAK